MRAFLFFMPYIQDCCGLFQCGFGPIPNRLFANQVCFNEDVKVWQPKKASTDCIAGTSLGIDQFGNEDLTNQETCYPTLESADVQGCNNADTNAAEMRQTADCSKTVYLNLFSDFK